MAIALANHLKSGMVQRLFMVNPEITQALGTLYGAPLRVPQLTWAPRTPIAYGAPLGPEQLNATADAPGTFTYTPPAGTTLAAGNGQALSARFVPSDLANWVVTSAQRTIDVTPSAPVAPVGQFRADVMLVERTWWDLTGAYATTVESNSLTLHLVHDPTGKLSGTATYTVAKDATLTMPIRGSVKGSHGSITMEGVLKGTDPAKTVSVSLVLNLTVDTAAGRLTGRLGGSLKTNGTTTPVSDDLTLPIPEPMDGTWTLALQLEQTGRAVTGTSMVTLSNGVEHAFVVQGRTSGANAVLSLSGDPADPASKAIKIRTTILPLAGGSAIPLGFSGRGYGQVIGW